MAMIQSAFTTCVYYIIQTSCQIDNHTSFCDGKMCECTKISYRKKCDVYANIHMKNVNDTDFEANINRDMCMKVVLLMDVYMNLVCVLSIYSFNFIMRIGICIIYVYNDVDVSTYEYVNVCADDNGYVYRYLYMHELENED